ncbi:MAG: BCD family MFS transporter [Caldilineaceae bacterium]|nr:BCD family MFS transporter [Caldilineaceae bacterium]
MNWKKVVQLTMVHVGVSITVVPVTSTLNRIMIADMHLSAFLVGLLISLPYLLSPLQVLVGSWADKQLVWGRHRSPWILVGGLMASFGSYLTAHAVFLMPDQFLLGLVAALVVFTIWGMGVNIASVSYLSLVTELGQENNGWRSRTVSIMWTAMILSTIATSLVLSHLLEPYSITALHTAFGVVWLVASLLVLFGAANIEPPAVAGRVVQHTANHPVVAFRLLLTNPSARRFFVYLLLVLVSIHAQDVLLEPFGAEVLQMAVAQTSRLTSIWGTGVFITLTGGLWVVRRYGKKRSANLGAIITALAFLAIMFTGIIANARLFMTAVFILGLGGGMMTVSNLSFMLDMTVPEAAGLYMGAWGVANFAGQALGNIISGLLRDLFYQATGQVIIGYLAVFAMEVVGLLIAIWIFRKISVDEFRRDAAVRIHEVLALAGN